MLSTLRKISVRKVLREKGKSSCIVAALFLTTVLFVIIFSTLFFVKDALNELGRKDNAWLADAAFIVTEDEAGRIEESPLVEMTGSGFHVGELEIRDKNSSAHIELVYYEEAMMQWMKCYPTIGRIPQSGKEIVVSDWFLEKQGIAFSENRNITLSFWIDDMEYTDTFSLVGVYDMNIDSKHVMLVSEDYYRTVKEHLDKLGKNSDEAMPRTMAVIFAPSRNLQELTFQLMEEIDFDVEKGGYLYNSFLPVDMGAGGWFILGCIILFVLLVGYLFISNIFQISITQEVKFYGRLAAMGVTAKEIRGIVYFGNNLLYLIAVIPAMIAGYAFTGYVLPGILNSFFTFQIQKKNNLAIFILALIFSYMTLLVSERKAARLAGQISPIEMRRFMGNYPVIKKADHKSGLWKLAVRGFWSDKRKAKKIILSISFSILLANTFYAMVKGFDAKMYIGRQLDADYTIAKTAFFHDVGAREKETLTKEELGEDLPSAGILAEGGAAACYVNLPMSREAWVLYDQIVGKDNLNNKEGNMLTYLYGLDDIMVDKLVVKEGEVDSRLYRSGDYVLIDALNDNGETCFAPGDEVTIPFSTGKEKVYRVMAVVELPYNLSYQTKYAASSNLFLPMTEWQEQTGREDYYLYTYDVKEEEQQVWDNAFSQLVRKNKTLEYKSAQTASEEAKEYISQLKLVGFVLSMILVCIGLMNFVNCMANNIYSRRREFAILESMGMRKAEIIGVISVQGLLYMAGSLLMGLLLAVPGVYIFIEKIWNVSYLQYSFYPELYLLFGAVGIVMAIFVPWICFFIVDRKEDFLTRIRACAE